MTDRELRRHIDIAVGRALVDRAYEQELLANPVVVLGQPLAGVHALSLVEFARVARAKFWGAGGTWCLTGSAASV